MTHNILLLLMLFCVCTKAQIKNDSIKVYKDTINEATAIKSDTLKHNEVQELQEVTILSTKSNRKYKNSPTRIELIDTEEVEEKSNMRPANVSMVLHESTGIQVQQTSATSGNASIRVQGLDGRYTQLLKDGYPNFGNFASGLSLLELPPLDLKQVEVIKGPASTLYGGGAIAGVVNFVSKLPKDKAEYKAIINKSNIGQLNIGGFASQKKGKFGYTFLGLFNKQNVYDVDNDNFTEIPKSDNFTINPKLFYYPNNKTTLMISNSYTQGNMIGGDINVINNKVDTSHIYFEKNKTVRNISTLEFDRKFNEQSSIKLKQSLSLFDRQIIIPNYQFSGFNTNAFADLSFLYKKGKHTLISGYNLVYDNFKDDNNGNLSSKIVTNGIFSQHTFDITEKVKLESGLRLDNANYSNTNFKRNQTFILPRFSALFKISNKLNTRIGGGLGYKVPTIFTEQTETNQYQNVLPLNNIEAEKSIGGTFDINYRTRLFKDLDISINQMFFYTQINKPLVLQSVGGNFSFINANKPVNSAGFETNLKFIFKEEFKFFVGYTFTDAKATYLTGNQFLPLLPKNKLNLTLLYEKEDNFKFGLEGYMTDRQFLTNGTQTPLFWEFGFMAEKTLWEHYAFFINFENFTDVRQSRYKRVVNVPNTNPTFDEIWTHTEGFVFNGGIKFKF
jgi:outer membrane receptor for ferrienterochelin and colicins